MINFAQEVLGRLDALESKEALGRNRSRVPVDHLLEKVDLDLIMSLILSMSQTPSMKLTNHRFLAFMIGLVLLEHQ